MSGRFVAVEVKPVRPLKSPAASPPMKADPPLKGKAKFRQFRLSVSPVTPEEWAVILELAGEPKRSPTTWAAGAAAATSLSTTARTGKRPGVLLAPEAPGRGPLVMSFARKLAEAGYVAFAMDYHGGAASRADRASGRYDAAPRRLHAADPAGIRAIAIGRAGRCWPPSPETDAARLAAIGYCFGGTTVLELARSGADVKAVVGFHSGLATAQSPRRQGRSRARSWCSSAPTIR